MMGFLCAREYFNGNNARERYLRNRITQLWETANWNWHAKTPDGMLYWHWSPWNDFDMNFPVRGWNECLITDIVSASSAKHSISLDTCLDG
jgi:hypothetical protein